VSALLLRLVRLPLLQLAVVSGHLGVIVPALILGALIAGVGHLTHSRALIVAGIVIIAAVSAYFSFVLEPHG
jgi:hypothetical protein